MAEDDDMEGDFDDDEQSEAHVLFQVRVCYPFESSCDVELNIKKGDVINVLRTDVGGGWWEGELNGALGLFPEKYTEKIEARSEAARSASGVDESARRISALPSEAKRERPMGRNPMLEGPCWEPVEPLVITVKTNPTKGSKFSGIKQFTTYEIRNTATGASVTRRYKHFSWLHARLVGLFPYVNIPPTPEKQIQGRFDENFIEQRRRKLQRFISRVAQHPVLGPSSVFLHFLSASDQKTWKTGKRSAEHEATSSFIAQIVPPGERPVDTDSIIGNFVRFFGWFDKQIHQLGKVLDEITGLQMGESAEYSKCANILPRLSDSIPATAKFDKSDIKPKYGEWWPCSSPDTMADLMSSMGRLGDGFSRVAAHLTEFQDKERMCLYDLMREYIAMMKTFPGIVKTHDTAWHDYNAASMKDTTTVEQRENMRMRCNAISCVVLSEFRHFHERAVRDFRDALRQYARGRVDFHQQAHAIWQSIEESLG